MRSRRREMGALKAPNPWAMLVCFRKATSWGLMVFCASCWEILQLPGWTFSSRDQGSVPTLPGWTCPCFPSVVDISCLSGAICQGWEDSRANSVFGSAKAFIACIHGLFTKMGTARLNNTQFRLALMIQKALQCLRLIIRSQWWLCRCSKVQVAERLSKEAFAGKWGSPATVLPRHLRKWPSAWSLPGQQCRRLLVSELNTAKMIHIQGKLASARQFSPDLKEKRSSPWLTPLAAAALVPGVTRATLLQKPEIPGMPSFWMQLGNIIYITPASQIFIKRNDGCGSAEDWE